MNLSTLNSTLQINAIHSKTTDTTKYSPSDIIKSGLQSTNTIKPLLLIQEVPNEALLFRTNDQQMVRSSRIRAAKLVCKQRLSQWTAAENTIFLSELGVDIERSAGILSHINRLHSDYMLAMDTPGQYF